MDTEGKVLRLGAMVIGAAVLLRLLGGGALGMVAQALKHQDLASVILYMETGRFLRQIPLEQEEAPSPLPQPEAQAAAVFSPEDALLVQARNYSSYSLDMQTFLQMPLQWNLREDGPAVLILHTHGSESYENTEGYEASSDYRTLDEKYNMVSVGDALAKALENSGIGVVHDRTLHDYPSYNGSYENARQAINAYLEEYPTIRLVLDIHRDAMEDSSGRQIASTVQVDGQTAAQLMMVVGTDAGGLRHPDWRENMALAVKLHAQLEKNDPGICRPISFRTQRFNQDLSPGAMLIEVGAAGNTRQEALVAAQALAEGIVQLAKGAITEDSTR